MSAQADNVPTKALPQFSAAASILQELATGKVVGYGYDQDMVEQRLADGFANAVASAGEREG